MAAVKSHTITRDEWTEETRLLSRKFANANPDEVVAALRRMEEFVINETGLTCTYRRNAYGKSHYATFCGSAGGHCSIIQIYNADCYLQSRCSLGKGATTPLDLATVNDALEQMSQQLNLPSKKGWHKLGWLSLKPVEPLLRIAAERIVQAK